jgi:hypothetical protein
MTPFSRKNFVTLSWPRNIFRRRSKMVRSNSCSLPCAIAEVHGGISALADKTHLNRQAMYKALSAQGNPTLTTLLTILNAVGLNLTFAPLPKSAVPFGD